MTDTPWTPGPWAVRHDNGAVWVFSKGGDRYIAGVEESGDGFVTLTEPNARLIAAAPEMAELLASIVEEYDKQDLINGEPGTDPFTMEEAAALLARISGAEVDA